MDGSRKNYRIRPRSPDGVGREEELGRFKRPRPSEEESREEERRKRVREWSPHRQQERVREPSPHHHHHHDRSARDRRPHHHDDGGEDKEHRRGARDRRPHHHHDGGEDKEHRRGARDRRPHHHHDGGEDKEHRRGAREDRPHHHEQEQEQKTGGNQLDEEDDHASLDATLPTRNLVLHNIFDPTVQETEEFYLQIQEEVHTKCAMKEAVLENIHIIRRTSNLCLRCDAIRSAEAAKILFDGSSYNGRSIKCSYMEEEQYKRRF